MFRVILNKQLQYTQFCKNLFKIIINQYKKRIKRKDMRIIIFTIHITIAKPLFDKPLEKLGQVIVANNLVVPKIYDNIS